MHVKAYPKKNEGCWKKGDGLDKIRHQGLLDVFGIDSKVNRPSGLVECLGYEIPIPMASDVHSIG